MRFLVGKSRLENYAHAVTSLEPSTSTSISYQRPRVMRMSSKPLSTSGLDDYVEANAMRLCGLSTNAQKPLFFIGSCRRNAPDDLSSERDCLYSIDERHYYISVERTPVVRVMPEHNEPVTGPDLGAKLPFLISPVALSSASKK